MNENPAGIPGGGYHFPGASEHEALACRERVPHLDVCSAAVFGMLSVMVCHLLVLINALTCCRMVSFNVSLFIFSSVIDFCVACSDYEVNILFCIFGGPCIF